MTALQRTTRRDLMKGTLAATALLAVGSETSEVTRLIAERRRLEEHINQYPGDLPPDDLAKWIRDVGEVGDRLADAPIRSSSDAVEVMRFVDSRLLEDDAVTGLDRALVRNVLTFMEG